MTFRDTRWTLREDDGGGFDYAGAMGEMPYGMHFGSPNQLYKTFVAPFTDVIKTAAGKTAELSARVQTAVKVAFEAVATTLVPALSSDYARIFATEKQKLDSIKQRYADVYRGTSGALLGNDVLVASFMFAPWAFLSAAMVKKSPSAALAVVQVLGGGNSVIERFVSQVKQRYGGSGGSDGKWSSRESPGADTWAFEGTQYVGCVIVEDAEGGKEPKRPPLAQLLTSRKLRAALESSPIARKMGSDGHNVIQATLRDVLEKAKAVLGASSIEDLERSLGKQVPALTGLKKLQDSERAQAEQEVLRRVRAAMRKVYTANLKAQAKSAIEAGLARDNPYVKAYADAIKKIEAL